MSRTSNLLSEVTVLAARSPDTNIEDIIEAAIYNLENSYINENYSNGEDDMTLGEEHELRAQQAKANRVVAALQEMDIEGELAELFGENAIVEALAVLAMEDADQLDEAHRRKSKLSRTRISDTRNPINRTSRDFKRLANSADSEFQYRARMALRGQGLAREGYSDDPFDDISIESVTAVNETAANTMRAAIVAKHKQSVAENDKTEAGRQLLAAVRERVEGKTAAQASIEARGTPSAQSIKDMLPKSWTDSDETPAVSFGRDIDTRLALPADFQPKTPKIETTVDASWGKAAKTIARPVASKAGIVNPSSQVNQLGDDEFPLPTAADAASGMSGADTYQKQPNAQGQTVMDPRTLTATLPVNGR